MTDQLQKPKISRVDKESMNSMLKTMIANDNSILPMSNVAPKIWFCDWYNAMDDIDKKNYNLYKEGEAVWINTEDLDAFTKSYNNITAEKRSICKNFELPSGIILGKSRGFEWQKKI